MTQHDRSPFSIRSMSAEDIASALLLCRESGWNQLQQDWQRLIAYDPDGCCVAAGNGQIAGTVTTTRYGRDLGWIGMMLVHPEFRRLGIATALIKHSVDYLKSRSVRCIKLDATPDGEQVYRKQGFEAEWSFQRWSREGSTTNTQTDPLHIESRLSDDVIKLDRSAFGADRSEFLRLLSEGSKLHMRQDGYGMLRPGFLASYLGPVSAVTPMAAESIIAELCRSADRTIFWDIPAPNTDAIRIARSLGFSPP